MVKFSINITAVKSKGGLELSVDGRIGIIGAGNVGEALISGLLKAKVSSIDKVMASDIAQQRCEYITNKYKIFCTQNNAEVLSQSSVVILCVKPKDIKNVLEEIKPKINPSHLLISIAAGVSINYIQKLIGNKIQIIRGMPNIAVLIREGMTVLSNANNVVGKNLETAMKIFSSVGKVIFLDEKLLDAVTGLSGSGPAYIYIVIEALSDAGIKVGLSREISTLLAAQTTLGAAKMVFETKEHPAKLRDMVTTPGGVAIDGLIELEEGKLRITLINAVVKATQKAKELLI